MSPYIYANANGLTIERFPDSSSASRTGASWAGPLCLRLRLPSWIFTDTSMGIPCSLSLMFSCTGQCQSTASGTCAYNQREGVERVATCMVSWRVTQFFFLWPLRVIVPLETGPFSEPPVKVALALRPFFLKSLSASREYATAERKSRTAPKLLALLSIWVSLAKTQLVLLMLGE